MHSKHKYINNHKGVWPASGEIDIMESRGNDPSYSEGGVDSFGSTLHWGPFFGADKYSMTHAEYKLPTGKTFSDDFHVFGLYWDKDEMYTYLDTTDNVVLKVPINESFWKLGGFDANPNLNNPWEGSGSNDNAPFDQDFFLILNVACGGTNAYFPDGQGGKPWNNKRYIVSIYFLFLSLSIYACIYVYKYTHEETGTWIPIFI